MSDLDAALRCYCTYFNPKYFAAIYNVDDVYVGYKPLNGTMIFTCRGSDDKADFVRDLESMDIIDDPDLGRIPAGLLAGVREVFTAITTSLQIKDRPIRLEGHSLGADHAYYLAALFIKAGFSNIELVLFAPAKPGDATFSAILAPAVVRCYRNGIDPVSEAPPFNSELVHPVEPIVLYCETMSPDAWSILPGLPFHRIQLYITALALKESGFL